MSNVDGAIKSLLQGISKQPRHLRQDGQCTNQVNMVSDAVRGLRRRAGFRYLGDISPDGNVHTCMYDGKPKVVTVDEEYVRIYDGETGDIEATIANTSGIIHDKVAVVQDKLLMWDSTMEVTVSTADDPLFTGTGTNCSQPRCYIEILSGLYSRTYKVTIQTTGGTYIAQHTTPDGTTSTHTAQVAASYIATKLREKIDDIPELSSVVEDNIIHVYPTIPTDVIISVVATDGDSGESVVASNGSVTSAVDLPTKAIPWSHMKISGLENDSIDDWYVIFVPDKPLGTCDTLAFVGGTWIECNDRFIARVLGNMPEVFRKEDTWVRVVRSAVWEVSRVGDTQSNPNPSFVGSTIQDIVVFQGRMVVLSGENVIISRTLTAGDKIDFWRETATDITDTDTIDIYSTTAGSGALKFAVPYNRDLIIFSDDKQYVIAGSVYITPNTITMQQTTSYSCAPIRPIAAGRNLYFYSVEDSPSVYEYYSSDTASINWAQDAAAHVKGLMRSDLIGMAGSINYNKAAAYSSDSIYLHEFLWNGNDKVQSAWGIINFPISVNIESVYFYGDDMYAVGKDPAGARSINRMQLIATDDPYLDMMRVITADGETTIAMNVPIDTHIVVCDATTWMPVQFTKEYVSDTAVELTFTHVGTVACGVPFRSVYTPTIPVLRDYAGHPVMTGRMILDTLRVHYEHTAHIEVNITDRYGSSYTQVYDFGDMPFRTIGDINENVGVYIAHIYIDADEAFVEFSTDKHYEMRFVSMEWTGKYSKSTRRV